MTKKLLFIFLLIGIFLVSGCTQTKDLNGTHVQNKKSKIPETITDHEDSIESNIKGIQPINPRIFFEKNNIQFEHYWPNTSENDLKYDESEILVYNDGDTKITFTSTDMRFFLDDVEQPQYSGTWEKFSSRRSWNRVEYINIDKLNYKGQILALEPGEKGKIHYHYKVDENIFGEQSVRIKINYKVGSRTEMIDQVLIKLGDLISSVNIYDHTENSEVSETSTTKSEDSTLSKLPSCENQKFTHSPIDLNRVQEITPLGNLNPPDHTIPTDHMYFHVSNGGTGEIIPLYSPGDIYIFDVTFTNHPTTPSGKEYSIHFALCKDVFGYYNHVKEISSGLEDVLSNYECEKWSHNPGNACSKKLLHFVSGGTIIGGVGHLQGNFDLGAYDYRTKLNYVNPSRFGEDYGGTDRPRSWFITCPLELYEDSLKKDLYNLVNRPDGNCGVVMQDIAGTLKGNWYHGTGLEWTDHLAFVNHNKRPSKSVISVGGVFLDAGFWEFDAQDAGNINRDFGEVVPDEIYCYYNMEPVNFGILEFSGRILVQLVSDNELKIEHQSGSCSGNLFFQKPTIYKR